jgi:hypothetical protein
VLARILAIKIVVRRREPSESNVALSSHVARSKLADALARRAMTLFRELRTANSLCPAGISRRRSDQLSMMIGVRSIFHPL